MYRAIMNVRDGSPFASTESDGGANHTSTRLRIKEKFAHFADIVHLKLCASSKTSEDRGRRQQL